MPAEEAPPAFFALVGYTLFFFLPVFAFLQRGFERRNPHAQLRQLHFNRVGQVYLIQINLVMGPSTRAPAATITLFPMFGWRFPVSLPVPPSVTP